MIQSSEDALRESNIFKGDEGLFNQKYHYIKTIGEGAFGTVVQAIKKDSKTQAQIICVVLEHYTSTM